MICAHSAFNTMMSPSTSTSISHCCSSNDTRPAQTLAIGVALFRDLTCRNSYLSYQTVQKRKVLQCATSGCHLTLCIWFHVPPRFLRIMTKVLATYPTRKKHLRRPVTIHIGLHQSFAKCLQTLLPDIAVVCWTRNSIESLSLCFLELFFLIIIGFVFFSSLHFIPVEYIYRCTANPCAVHLIFFAILIQLTMIRHIFRDLVFLC
mmetsp:Transcript_30353/g.49412  ORF Transcript_30353/g.49412 Transcript_30353/m.49412 type:complete len:205 (-) Transcript_30353:262-876(-)